MRDQTGPAVTTSYPGTRGSVGAFFGLFFVDFSVYFLVGFLDDFWNHFGCILGAKMERKTMKNQSKIRLNFYWIFDRFLDGFWLILGVFSGARTLIFECFV